MDILEGLNPNLWPEVNLGSLSLEEPWRLRTSAAQAWCIVKARDVARFPWVLELLDVTFRLLPTLVAPIKHMKIMYGLKTMVIMWMIQEDQGVVNIVRKTIQLFPGRLAQYRGCSHHEMFLMRKNQQEFKTLAQSLAMDQSRRQAYIQHLMQEQYGESYAQKLEDRLSHYLHQLDAALPRETYSDQLLKKDSPFLLHDELLLRRLLACESDSLNRILLSRSSPRCDSRRDAQREEVGPGEGGGGRPASPGGAPENSEEASTEGGLSKVAGPLAPRLTDGEQQGRDEAGLARRSWVPPCCGHGGKEGAGLFTETDNDTPLLFEEKEEEESRGETKENRKGADGGVEMLNCVDADDRKWTEKSQDKTREEMREQEGSWGGSSPDEETPPLHLCSRHQRWVRNILHQCSDEDELASPTTLHHSCTSSEELTPAVLPLLPHSSLSPSLLHPPPLPEPGPFRGDTPSTSSSQDLTPSLLLQSLSPPDGNTSTSPHPPSKDSQDSGEAGGVAFCTDPMGLLVCRRPHHTTPPQPSCKNEQTPSLLQSTRSTFQEKSASPPRMKQLVVRLHRLDIPIPTLAILLPQPPTSDLQRSPRTCPWKSASTQTFPLKSWALQPQVQLTRLPQQQLRGGTPQSETGEEEDEYCDLDINTLYSSSESDEDVGCRSPDPNYRPHHRFPIMEQRDRSACVRM